MYTVAVIDGRANGLPILDFAGPFNGLQRPAPISTAKSRKARFVSIVPGSSPPPEQTSGCLKPSRNNLQGREKIDPLLDPVISFFSAATFHQRIYQVELFPTETVVQQGFDTLPHSP
jgi:hypothetical protein